MTPVLTRAFSLAGSQGPWPESWQQKPIEQPQLPPGLELKGSLRGRASATPAWPDRSTPESPAPGEAQEEEPPSQGAGGECPSPGALGWKEGKGAEGGAHGRRGVGSPEDGGG